MNQNSSPNKPNSLQVATQEPASFLMHLRALLTDDTSETQDSDVVIPLRELASSDSSAEYWCDGLKVTQVLKDQMHCRHSDKHLLVSFQTDAASMFEITKEVYQRAYQLSQELGFEHLLRTWNFLNDIHAEEAGIERYQVFCVARHEVMETLQQLEKPNPAATAIGTHNGMNHFVFLFGQEPGAVIENKRQISAWQYPKKYAPKQPRFSRAIDCGNVLMCSGTASVVGHETIHLDDLEAQLVECLNNIQALLDASCLDVSLQQGLFRFYLRNSSESELVVSYLQQHGIKSFVILEGDICRENLLIECEAVFQKN